VVCPSCGERDPDRARIFRYGSALERAHALFGRGRVLRALGDPDAEPALDLAAEAFAALRAEPRLEQIGAIGGARAAAT
jgi:hypothetical protein